MITKKRLLSGLRELIYVEEGFTSLHANFTKTMVSHAEELNPKTKHKIEKMLFVLQRDSEKHLKMVDNLINRVGSSRRDEY